MAISLYKEGDTHVVRGVKCEILTCHHSKLDEYLSQGYVTAPEDLAKAKTEVKDIEEAVIVDDIEEALELTDE